jgi:D-cysteine desulfhydrase
VTSAAQALDAIPRLRLAKLPTPIDELANQTRELRGPTLIVKRDDLTGLAGGGNKVRKLEFLIADAVKQRADCLITVGGPQSNHCRQTAAAAAVVRLPCHLVLGGDPQPLIGNSLIDHLLGATIHWTPRAQRSATLAALADELRSQGRRPYVIPVGGSTAVGALGYVAAMFELVEQLTQQGRAVHQVVFATSSGGTQAGIVLGARLAGFKGRITAISIDQTPDDQADPKFLAGVCAEANVAAALLGADVRLTAADFATNYDYLGAGYGVVGELERDAIKLFARAEGLLVGPVYTGRAAGALIDLIRRGVFTSDETVLFWHTGDDVALHAYAHDLS